MKKILKYFIVLILVIFIIGGISYVGYTLFLANHAESAKHNVTEQNNLNTVEKHNTIELSKSILKSKDFLSKANEEIKTSLPILTKDIYKPITSSLNTKIQQTNLQYDMNKMMQIHMGLYKTTIGIQNLETLNSNFENLAKENFNSIKYEEIYNIIKQQQFIISESIMYLNEFYNIINTNPYIYTEEYAVDTNKMNEVHNNLIKYTQGLTHLNEVNNELSKQLNILELLNKQNLTSNENSNNSNHNSQNPLSFVTAILIILSTVFIIGIIGYIYSFIKINKRKEKENENKI